LEGESERCLGATGSGMGDKKAADMVARYNYTAFDISGHEAHNFLTLVSLPTSLPISSINPTTI
jgi:hypothetical protein